MKTNKSENATREELEFLTLARMQLKQAFCHLLRNLFSLKITQLWENEKSSLITSRKRKLMKELLWERTMRHTNWG